MIHSFFHPTSIRQICYLLPPMHKQPENTLQNKEEKSVSATNYLLISVPKLQKRGYQKLAGQTFRYTQAWIARIYGPNQLLCNRNKDNRIRNNVYPDTAISHYFCRQI